MGKNTIDLATLQIINKCSYDIFIKTQSLWCFQCEPYHVATISKYGNSTIHVNTTHETIIQVEYSKVENIYSNCRKIYKFGDHGNYLLDVWDVKGLESVVNLYQSQNNFTCNISVTKDPINSNLPILWFSLLTLTLLFLWNFRRYAGKNCGISSLWTFVRGRRFQTLDPAPGSPVTTPHPSNFHERDDHFDRSMVSALPWEADESLLDIGPQQPKDCGSFGKSAEGVLIVNNQQQEELCQEGRGFAGGVLARAGHQDVAICSHSHACASVSLRDASFVPNTYSCSGGPSGRRFTFLDTLRGITVMLMIFFNYGGGKYWFFQHAPWNGMTYADIVFPSFVFVMGFSFMLSFGKRTQQGVSRKSMIFNVLKRSTILFLLGFILSNMDSNAKLANFRIMGVLQRLALVYLMLASIFIISTLPQVRQRFTWKSFNLVEMGIVGILISTQFLYLFGKAPDCPRGYNGPGGMYMNSSHPHCTGGFSGYVDRIILGSNHMYQNPTCKKVYQTTVPFDPEGILGTFSATLLAYLGTRATKTYMANFSNKNYIRIIVFDTVSFVILGGLAGALCGFRSEGGFVPINKNLWSPSYTLATGALSHLALMVCFLLIDVIKVWDGVPFNFVGMNPLLIYIGHEVLRDFFPFNLHLSHQYMNSHTYLYMQDLWACMLWLGVAFVLYKKKIFISL